MRDQQPGATRADSGEQAESQAPEDSDARTTFVTNQPIPPILDRFGPPARSASDQAYGNPFHVPAAGQRHSDSVKRMHSTLLLAERDAGAVVQTLVPGYKHARDARDVESVAELGGRLIGTFTRMNGAKAALDEMRAHAPARQSMSGSSIEQDLENFQLQQYVDTHAPALEHTIVQTRILAMLAMVPHEFRGESVAGNAIQVDVEGTPQVLRAKLAGELDRTIEMLLLVHELTELVLRELREPSQNTTRDAFGRPSRTAFDEGRGKLSRWASRPVDIAFLKAALGPMWNVLDATAGPGDAKPSDVLAQATRQADHTGWLGDIGDFDIQDAQMWLHLGGQDNAAIVLRKLYTTDPDTRTRLLIQMKERGLLDKFCRSFGWQPIKELHDSLGIGPYEIKKDLQKYFLDDPDDEILGGLLGGKDKFGPGLHSEWESHDNSVYHYLDEVPHVGGALNFVYDLATFGFNSSYGKSRDAYKSGQMSESDYADNRRHLVGRTAAIAFVSTITGGAADKLVRGGAATVTTTRAMAGGFAGGSVGATAGLASSDAYNVYASGQQDQFSSPEDYIKAALVGGALGGAFGGALNGLSKRARGHVPDEAIAAEEAAAAIATAGKSPYRAIENPRVASAAQKSGLEVSSLSDAQLGMLDAAEAAIARGDVRAAVQIGDDLVTSGVAKSSVTRFETELAHAAGVTSPEVYRNPRAVLPDGSFTEPSAHGGDLYYGTAEVAPGVVFAKGLPTRGTNTKLLDHAQQAGDSAFRGTTRSILTPDGEGGAGQWAGEDGWVYKIDATPSWDVNVKLQGRVKRPDGSFGDSPMPGEHEQAVLASIPPERIVGAYRMKEVNGHLRPGPFEPNPNYKPLK